MDIKIGAQYYTVREFCRDLKGFDETCKKVSEIGYKSIQLSGTGDFEAEDIKSITDKYGLEVVCTHRGYDKYVNNLDEEIKFHKTIGANICGLGAFPRFSEEKITIERIEEFVNQIKPVAQKLKENGLVFAYHNHAFEFAKIDGRYIFDILTEKMGSDNFKYILDVYWLAVAGINPVKFIKQHRKNIACVHLKDLKVVDNKPYFAKVGEGNLPWDEIITALKETGVEYALVEQDVCDSDPFDCLKESYKYLNGSALL